MEFTIAQLVFAVVLAIACIVWIGTEVLLAKRLRAMKSDDKEPATSSEKIIWRGVAVANCLGIPIGIMGKTGTLTFPNIDSYTFEVAVSGLALIILGLLIRWSAILTLKKYFTVNLAVQDGQRIIKHGLYRWMRHPGYTGQILSFAGLGLVYSNWLCVLAFTIPVVIVFLHRIQLEEALLIEDFGDEYREYSNTTKRFIPFIY